MKNTRQLIYAALFVATGVILPQLFHLVGAGSVFLPMHIPVLLSGFMLGWPYALAVGALTPLLSSLVTGMPPMVPVLLHMLPELAVYGLCASLLSHKLRWNVYPALLCTMVAGRLAAMAAVWVLVRVLALPLPGALVFAWNAVVTGWPGILLQIVVVPPLALLLRRAMQRAAA